MSQDKSSRPIVIRRKRRATHVSHGAWKIAYADFMTAMMAFFLVMWLLSGLSDNELENVSEYFRTPLRVALVGGDKNTASDSAIPGGGDSPIHTKGAVSRTTPRAVNYHSDNQRLRRLKAELQAQIKSDPKLSRMSSQLKVDIVDDGLRIQIFDSKKRPMFALGSAHLQPGIAPLLARIAETLSTVDNKITISGHTDDLRYAAGPSAYSNWELSADRANAARRAMVEPGGMPRDKLLRVIGAADTQHIAGDLPGSPLNRRISILLLNDRAQRRIEGDPQVPKPLPQGTQTRRPGEAGSVEPTQALVLGLSMPPPTPPDHAG